MTPGLLNDKALEALRKVERDSAYHDKKNERIKRQQEAYEGIMHQTSVAAGWESKLHPPLINHAIETSMTMLVDDDMQFEVKPVPKVYEGGEWRDAVAGGEALEALFRQQLRNDRFNEFQRPFVLTAAINRVAVAKTHWKLDRREVKYLENKPMVSALGRMSPRRLTESTKVDTLFDGPVTEVVDLRDFYWNEAAVSLDVARYCAHAVWMSEADLRAQAKAGVYSQAAVDLLCQPNDGKGDGRSLYPDGNEIELEREQRGRKNGLYEVLEVWDRDTMMLHVIGGRKVLLAQMDWPFWHQQFPFVAMSLAPFPFSIQGLSLVEKLADMQTAFWDLLNQTRDNVKLINNAIILMASDYDDPDSFEYAPGAVNTVDNPQQVVMWTPNVNIAQVAMPLLEKIQTDMQNLAMGQPISIPMAGRVTATEIATLAQIAQTAAKKMKDQVVYALERIGYQRMRLNQQYIRTPQPFIRKGKDSQPEPYVVPPHVFQGDYQFNMIPTTESDVRAERRSEAQALLQAAVQAAPVFAMAHQPLNLRPFMDRVLDSYDIDDKDEFYSSMPQQLGPAGPDQGTPGQEEGAGPGGQPVGVTGPNSINPAVSPSAQASLAPGVMMARAMASQGGTTNIAGK